MKQSHRRTDLINEITDVLQKLPIVTNLARKKFVSHFVIGLIKSRNVQFCEIAQHLNDKAKIASNQNRIQDFFRDVTIDYYAVAVLLISLLPKNRKLRLCIDRTEWDFGNCQVNILMVLVGCDDIQIPLYWELLDNKSGNSNAEDRINLLDLCLNLIGKERVGLIVGDREFVGSKWFRYRKDNKLPFVMRMPKNHSITNVDGRNYTVSDLFFESDEPLLVKECQVDGVWGHAWIMALDKGEYLFLFGTAPLKFMGQFYRKRWTIEVCFQNLKGRGFNLELTHVKCLLKLKKLVALVSISYCFCVSLGVYVHDKVQKIKHKKHGCKEASFSRHGLNQIREMSRDQSPIDLDLQLKIRSLFRWLKRQLPDYQLIKIAR